MDSSSTTTPWKHPPNSMAGLKSLRFRKVAAEEHSRPRKLTGRCIYWEIALPGREEKRPGSPPTKQKDITEAPLGICWSILRDSIQGEGGRFSVRFRRYLHLGYLLSNIMGSFHSRSRSFRACLSFTMTLRPPYWNLTNGNDTERELWIPSHSAGSRPPGSSLFQSPLCSSLVSHVVLFTLTQTSHSR